VEQGETPLDLATETELITKAIAGYFGSGKFQVLLDLPGATDIMVNGPDAVWVQYSDGRAERYAPRLFADDDDLRAEVARLARRAGGTERRFDDGKPLLVLRLPDGSRMAATMVVSPHVNVAIRRNVLPAASLEQLVQLGTIDEGMRSLLAAAMRARMRIVVSGETGAGKSTLTRALIHELPVTTRMVVIEDTRELNIADDAERALAVLEWETREANVEGVGEITQSDLVRQALRFNPEWLIVGEVRDAGAAREMLLAMQHGHPSLSTVHHHSAATAWRKLAQYITQGADAMAFEIAALVISDAVDFFVHLARDRGGRRVVAEICETAGWNGTEVQLNRIYVPDESGRGRPQVHLSDARRRRLVQHGFDDGLLMNPEGWWQR
jgi:Flp pilus assembly CpaF family ATPase